MAHLYTIGHSTIGPEEFIELLREHDIRILVDVRRFPSSRRHPHFNRENLTETLQRHDTRYKWLGEQLGGYRKKGLGEGSPNKAWMSQGFRNYADHTMTEQFRDGIEKVLKLAEEGRLALMCAEQVYWRCHRRIISDYLKAKGHTITHIIGKGITREHELTGFAKAIDGELRYPWPCRLILATQPKLEAPELVFQGVIILIRKAPKTMPSRYRRVP